MAEACYTAQATTQQQVLGGINKLTLQTNKHGQYAHDAILLIQKGIQLVHTSQFNPSDPGKGMVKFLDDSITLAEDKCTIMAKVDESNKKGMAINTAHTRRGTTNIEFAQRGRNTPYSLGSTFNRMIEKINKYKHVSFAATNSVHKYINNKQPIMVTYDSGADGHYISKKDWRQAGLPIL